MRYQLYFGSGEETQVLLPFHGPGGSMYARRITALALTFPTVGQRLWHSPPTGSKALQRHRLSRYPLPHLWLHYLICPYGQRESPCCSESQPLWCTFVYLPVHLVARPIGFYPDGPTEAQSLAFVQFQQFRQSGIWCSDFGLAAQIGSLVVLMGSSLH